MAMLLKNSPQRYGVVAMALHWLIAVMIIGMLIGGLIMGDLDPAGPGLLGMSKFEIYQLHKSFGITVLLLSLLRLAWRLANPVPPMPANMKTWERIAARVTHWGFYFLMIAIPLSGWAMVSASPWGIPTVIFGLFEWPHIAPLTAVEDKEAVEHLFYEIHEYLAFGAIALLGLHIAAAGKHALVLKDGVVGRMVPGLSTKSPSASTREGV